LNASCLSDETHLVSNKLGEATTNWRKLGPRAPERGQFLPARIGRQHRHLPRGQEALAAVLDDENKIEEEEEQESKNRCGNSYSAAICEW
jgi:hypothetical protein